MSWSIAWVICYLANISLLILSAFRTFVTKNQVAIYSNTSMHWERIEIDDPAREAFKGVSYTVE